MRHVCSPSYDDKLRKINERLCYEKEQARKTGEREMERSCVKVIRALGTEPWNGPLATKKLCYH